MQNFSTECIKLRYIMSEPIFGYLENMKKIDSVLKTGFKKYFARILQAGWMPLMQQPLSIELALSWMSNKGVGMYIQHTFKKTDQVLSVPMQPSSWLFWPLSVNILVPSQGLSTGASPFFPPAHRQKSRALFYIIHSTEEGENVCIKSSGVPVVFPIIFFGWNKVDRGREKTKFIFIYFY